MAELCLQKDIFVTPDNSDFCTQRKYEPFDFGKREIRLLRINSERLTAETLPHVHPEWLRAGSDAVRLSNGQSDEEIHVDFICCSLTKPIDLDSFNQKYVALSYCAGKPTDSRRIMIDGYWFNAFVNLEHALEELRIQFNGEAAGCNLVWADQVCIDQSNHRERSHQVNFMRNIYERAEVTYVVLSTPIEPFRDARNGTEALRLMNKHLEVGLQDPKSRSFTAIDRAMTGYSEFFLNKIYQEPDHPVCEALPQLFKLLDQILEAKWWQRAWVFQEFVVSRRVSFIFGSQCISLGELEHFIYFHDWNSRNPETVSRFTERTESIHREKIARWVELLENSARSMALRTNSSERTLFFLHQRRRSVEYAFEEPFFSRFSMLLSLKFQAADPRDLFYAFVGLSKFTSKIVPDYSSSNSVFDVSLQVTETLLETLDSLSLLRRVVETKPTHTEDTPELPSWLPDWTSDQRHIEEGRLPYQFPSGSRHCLLRDSKRSRWKILRVQGVFLSPLGKKDNHGIFHTILPISFVMSGPVEQGDELWALNNGLGIHVLRRRSAGGYSLKGLAFALPGRPTSRIGSYLTIPIDNSMPTEYEVVTDAVERDDVKWIDIF